MLQFWILLTFVSLLAALSDVVYKLGATKVKDEKSGIKGYIQSNLIIISWIIILVAKILVGIPYTEIDLSIAVPVNNTFTALFGSLLGVIYLKEKINKDILKAYIFSILSCVCLIGGDVI